MSADPQNLVHGRKQDLAVGSESTLKMRQNGGLDQLIEQFQSQGQTQGEGQFTWDLSSALSKLSDFALPDPDAFILRLVAAATACGASFFRVELEPHGYVVEWDGQAYTSEDLAQLMPHILGGVPRLTELAIALITAGKRHTLLLEVPEGQLSLKDSELRVLTEKSKTEVTRLRLHTTRWQRLKARFQGNKALALLRPRCFMAAIRWQLPEKFPVQGLPQKTAFIQFGDPPRELSHEPLLHLSSGDGLGAGFLLLEDYIGADLVCTLGVSYPLRDRVLSEHTGLLWWMDELSLDLSRSSFVEDGPYTEWRERLVVLLRKGLSQVCCENPQRPDLDESICWLIKNTSELDHLECFRRVDSSPVSLQDLQRQFGAQGYMATSEELWMENLGIDPATILHLDPRARKALGDKLPHQIPVDHFKGVTVETLEPDTEYLTVYPAFQEFGLVGIRADFWLMYRTMVRGNLSENPGATPYVDCSTTGLAPVKLALGDLLRVLFHLEDIDPEFRLHHTLAALTCALFAVFPEGTSKPALSLLYDTIDLVSSGGRISGKEIRKLCQRASVAACDGSRVSLNELLERGADWNTQDLVMRVYTKQSLTALLGPFRPETLVFDPNVAMGFVYGPLTGPAWEALKHSEGSLSALEMLLQTPDCAAFKVLQKLCPNLAELGAQCSNRSDSDDGEHDALLSYIGIQYAIAGTELLLIAMVNTDCTAGSLLLEHGLDEDKLFSCALESGWFNEEAHGELDELMGQWGPGEILQSLRFSKWLLLQAHGCSQATQALAEKLAGNLPLSAAPQHISLFKYNWFISQGEYEQALQVAELSSKRDPSHLNSVGICLGLLERFDEAADVYRQAIELNPEWPSLWANYAEDLTLANKPKEALEKVEKALELDPQHSQSLGIKALLLQDSEPARALELCEKALAQPKPVLSVWETKGYLQLRLGQKELGLQSLENFVALADPSVLLENRLEERLARARLKVQELKAGS